MEEASTNSKKAVLIIACALALCLVVAVIFLMLGGHLRPSAETAGTTTQTTQTETTAFVDVTPPVITGATDKTFHVGEPVSYRAGITAVDPEEGTVALNIDTSAVNAATEGTYPVIYWAEDSAGNRAEITVQITFIIEQTEETVAEESENTDVPKYKALAQKVYNKIIKDNMTEEQKIKAIWKWSRYKISFSGWSKKDDWKQGAVVGFTKLKGDCFNYYATSKALLELAGIPTKDVVKIKMEGRSNHFWLLVKHKGSWWHFDSCPRTGAKGRTFCLYTDQQMLEFSETHKDCFDFDLRLYPRTPGTISDKYLIRFYPEWFDASGKRLKDANGNLAGTPNYDPDAPAKVTEPTVEETTVQGTTTETTAQETTQQSVSQTNQETP